VAHELSTHPNAHSIWYCHACPSLDSPNCALAFPDRTSFEQHFSAQHPKDENDNWRYLTRDDFHLGPEADQLFWCGFCRKVLACNMMLSWKVDRFEHVAGHFSTQHARLEHFEMKKWRYPKMWSPEEAKAPVAVMVAEAWKPPVAGKAPAVGKLAMITPKEAAVAGEAPSVRKSPVVRLASVAIAAKK
jgi:hypothetical protein